MKLTEESWHDFVAWFSMVREAVHRNARSKGWYDGGERNVPEQLALIHSEVSEALEALREGNPPDKHCAGFSSFEIELADIVIRVMDLAAYKNVRLGEAIKAKAQFNETRPHKHGKTF